MYENKSDKNYCTKYLADEKLKRVGQKLRFQFQVIKELNKKITPKEIIKVRKEFRTSVFVRNIYSEVLNIIQPIVISKIKKNKNKQHKKYLSDSLLTSIAGISEPGGHRPAWVGGRILSCSRLQGRHRSSPDMRRMGIVRSLGWWRCTWRIGGDFPPARLG